jgi:hypothetical protein
MYGPPLLYLNRAHALERASSLLQSLHVFHAKAKQESGAWQNTVVLGASRGGGIWMVLFTV